LSILSWPSERGQQEAKGDAVQYSKGILWIWYMAGAIATLLWKWQRYVYESKGRGIAWWPATKEWFEITTYKSKVSWIATFALVWFVGGCYIHQIGLSWLMGGIFLGMPVMPSGAALLGVLLEHLAPAFLKWIMGKIPIGIQDRIGTAESPASVMPIPEPDGRQ
jgi:hypothetical protein